MWHFSPSYSLPPQRTDVQRFEVDENDLGEIRNSEVLVDGEFGALFDIIEGPDGFLYFSSRSAIHRIVPE